MERKYVYHTLSIFLVFKRKTLKKIKIKCYREKGYFPDFVYSKTLGLSKKTHSLLCFFQKKMMRNYSFFLNDLK